MAEYVTRMEFENRVGALERAFDDKKQIKRQILEQMRRNGDALAAMKNQLGRIEIQLDGVEAGLCETRGRSDSLMTDIRDLKSLVGELPTIITGAVRQALREYEGKGS